MSTRKGFFTKRLKQIILTIDCLSSPVGTSIEELCTLHQITRRSVFRILNEIEHDLHFPVVVSREEFGGTAVYRLPEEFVSRLECKQNLQISLCFNEVLMLYLLLGKDMPIMELSSNEVFVSLQSNLATALNDTKDDESQHHLEKRKTIIKLLRNSWSADEISRAINIPHLEAQNIINNFLDKLEETISL